MVCHFIWFQFSAAYSVCARTMFVSHNRVTTTSICAKHFRRKTCSLKRIGGAPFVVIFVRRPAYLLLSFYSGTPLFCPLLLSPACTLVAVGSYWPTRSHRGWTMRLTILSRYWNNVRSKWTELNLIVSIVVVCVFWNKNVSFTHVITLNWLRGVFFQRAQVNDFVALYRCESSLVRVRLDWNY